MPWLKRHASTFDAVIVDGIWNYASFGAWRALHNSSVPYFVFTHGMLGPWFKQTYPLKHLKKWLYWPWAEYRVLRDATFVLFTCEEERLLARESFFLYKARERVVVSGVATPPIDVAERRRSFLAAFPPLVNKRLILFLGRIHQVKGVDLLIEAFANQAHTDANLHLVIAGPDQTGLVAPLKRIAEKLGISHRITWTGMLLEDLKWGAYFAADIFILPSHHENFGNVVAQALSCGLPVLISNKVNIWREIEADHAGLVEDDTRAGTIRLLQRWLEMPGEDRIRMRHQTKQTFFNRFEIHKAAESLLAVLSENVSGRDRIP